MTQKIKLSRETVEVLENFSSINKSLLVRPGSEVRTISDGKNVFAKARLAESFESEFAIYDLSTFLGVLSLFTDPELTIGEKGLTIAEGSRKMTYPFTDKSLILVPPEKNITLPTVDVSFHLDAAVLRELQKAATATRLPEYEVAVDSKSLVLRATNTRDPSMTYSIAVAAAPPGLSSTFVFKKENLKLLPLDYEVTISTKGIASFACETRGVSYFVATENRQ